MSGVKRISASQLQTPDSKLIMKELWLKFKDENGNAQRVLVDSDNFFIGRGAENNLSIANNKLSRQHAKIEKFPEGYAITDCRSSNGTFLNGEDLSDPLPIKNGDTINLGGGVNVEVEFVSEQQASKKSSSSSKKASSNSASDGSIPTAVFFIAPVLVILMLVCGGGAIFIFSNNDNRNDNNQRIVFNDTPVEDTPNNESPTPKPSTSGEISNNGTSPKPEESPSSTRQVSNPTQKIEQNAASFLQHIALNDPSAFIDTKQAELVASRIKSLQGSSALAENLKAVKRDASQYQALAQSKGFKPQFLAIAAVARLGNSTGNPLETAKQMLPVLSGLRISLANNLADDNLMIIAAFEQGKAGKFKDLRNVLEGLGKKIRASMSAKFARFGF